MSETTWNEDTTCARCGTSLDNGFECNHLGVRFCTGCFEDGVRDKMEERVGKPVEVTESCSRCDGSLINGCRENYIGVLYCLNCFERTHNDDGYPLEQRDESERAGSARIRRRKDEREDLELSSSLMDSNEEDEAIYLHDVFLVTTLFALILYAVSRLSGSLFSLSGF